MRRRGRSGTPPPSTGVAVAAMTPRGRMAVMVELERRTSRQAAMRIARSRFAPAAAGDQEVEVAAFVGLQHRAMKERCIAAFGSSGGASRRLARERLAPALELALADEKLKATRGDVEADRISIAHQG